jgi:hypothetical protein
MAVDETVTGEAVDIEDSPGLRFESVTARRTTVETGGPPVLSTISIPQRAAATLPLGCVRNHGLVRRHPRLGSEAGNFQPTRTEPMRRHLLNA